MLTFGLVALGFLVIVVVLVLASGRRMLRQAAAIRARTDQHVTVTSPRTFQHECTFRTKASAESVHNYFLDFSRHPDWEARVRKVITWQGRSFVVRCEGPPSTRRAMRLKQALSRPRRVEWNITASEQPVSVDWEVSWDGEHGPIVGIMARLTLAVVPFGTVVTFSEDSTHLIPQSGWARRLGKFEDAELQQKMADRMPDHQITIARSQERVDRFRRAMETATRRR